jgi:hypothetical protein
MARHPEKATEVVHSSVVDPTFLFYFFFGSRSGFNFNYGFGCGSGLFMKNKFELQII